MTRRIRKKETKSRPTPRENLLSKEQEYFVFLLLEGKTKREAYIQAFPHSKDMKSNNIGICANSQFNKANIQRRYAELKKLMDEEDIKMAAWNREKSIRALQFVIDRNKMEMERVNIAFEEELHNLKDNIKNDPENADFYLQEMIKKSKTNRIKTANNTAIIEATSELNKMLGYHEQTINMNSNIIFNGDDDLDE